ncbi:MAG TPA: PAS domain-containing protein, partial [Allocoleopsis sp.]
MFTDIDTFSHQIFALSNRCSILLDRVSGSSSFTPSHTADALKELGVATEELQVALEELQQQNERLSEALEQAAIERKRYQDLFQSAPQAYLITTLDGTIKEANRAAAQLIGVPAHFLEGKPLLLYVSEADRPLYWRELRQRQQYDSFREWQFWLQSRQQLLVQVACSISVIR